MLLFSIVTPFCQRKTSRLHIYKLAYKEYLGCTRDQPMQGFFPPHTFFEGKALGTRLYGPGLISVMLLEWPRQ